MPYLLVEQFITELLFFCECFVLFLCDLVGGYPNQLDKSSLHVTYMEDLREKFLGYSIANISWSLPNSKECVYNSGCIKKDGAEKRQRLGERMWQKDTREGK